MRIFHRQRDVYSHFASESALPDMRRIVEGLGTLVYCGVQDLTPPAQIVDV